MKDIERGSDSSHCSAACPSCGSSKDGDVEIMCGYESFLCYACGFHSLSDGEKSPVKLPKPYYDFGGITLYHADALEVVPLLSFDLMLTDPPYGIALSNHAKGKERSNRDWTIANDDTQEVGQAVLDLWHGPTVAFASPMKPWPGKWRQHLVWEKGEHVGGGGDPATCWRPSFELIQVRNNKPLDGRRDGAVLRFQAVKTDYTFHPSPKPVSLLEYLICKTKPQRVCDPFSGGGSTLVAAKRCGVEAVGVEIEERHCETIAKRLAQGVLF